MIVMQQSRHDERSAPEQRVAIDSSPDRFRHPSARPAIAHLELTEQLSGPFWVLDLQARYFDVIDRYVRKRVADHDRAREIVSEVFAAAAVESGEVQANPLPWLISTARRACAHAQLGEFSALHRAIA